MSNSHSDQLRALEFYKQEIGILKPRLTVIGAGNTGIDVVKQLDHFENQFQIQIDNIDHLSHDIHTNVSQIAKELQASTAGYVDKDLVLAHERLSEKFAVQEKAINEIRQEYDRFSATWL